MMGFLGDPTRLFIKPEKPVFLLRTVVLGSLASSEKRLGLINWFSMTRRSWAFSPMVGAAPVVKLAD